ncbi:hypothetical protein [Neisseria shayeganii]|uniref:N-acetyltransferase domain-containing protein n=1 Tax=Neisseria shayeganii 871 TaxID=1032488 RepID=G4CGH0_9NEIS|nr:hypothetical protein [Neisseria shayeganii]EGY53082.1 hypothetical protein HMPREF9371_0709 [Neisseria shayeganii 871]
MTRIRFFPATEADDAELRALLRRNVMDGPISLTFRREPSYFAAAAIQGAEAEIYKGVDTDSGRLAGLGGLFRFPAYFNGELRTIGYLADLRLEAAYRNGLALRRAYDFLRQQQAGRPLPVYTSMILQDNRAALSILAARRAGLPDYLPQGRVHTPMIQLAWPKAAVQVAGVTLARGRAGDEKAVFAFINREHARRQFAPHYGPADLHNGRLRGLQMEDFQIARRGGEIVGVLAAWDQHASRQIHVEGYRGAWRRLKPFYNALCRFTPYHPLPAPGGMLPYFYVSLVAVAGDDLDVFRALLRALYRERRRGPWHYMVCALHERDPLLPALAEYRRIEAGGELFTVVFDAQQAEQPDGRVPYVEPGAL